MNYFAKNYSFQFLDILDKFLIWAVILVGCVILIWTISNKDSNTDTKDHRGVI